MSVSPVIALRRAVRAALLADADLVAALGGPHVFDEAPPRQRAPYVAFADASAREPLRERWKQYKALGLDVNKYDM